MIVLYNVYNDPVGQQTWINAGILIDNWKPHAMLSHSTIIESTVHCPRFPGTGAALLITQGSDWQEKLIFKSDIFGGEFQEFDCVGWLDI